MSLPIARGRIQSTLRQFLDNEASGGIVLMAAAILAIIIANSSLAEVISRQSADETLARLVATDDDKALVSCGLVIEAVCEDMSVKAEVFSRLDAIMPREAVLATNTSYLDVDHLSAIAADRTRVLGLHFFAPAHVMKVLEIVRGKKTGGRALATGAALARRLKKIAVVAGVCHGFMGNSMMAAYRRDCHRMLLEGALPHQIDAAMRDFGSQWEFSRCRISAA
ncbi:3-hydroxyacyl-CoA dehydrogenase [Rhizobium binae]|uniref:3-hydroxyacyl-CoA dehydrogenase n=1 Tax=Rhizobium binae TaxID=1138190 RepID=A0ABV2MQ36_9HYPH|nr:3-hydroxyacyl-CoA dehydrogenase family protein [Rhizobium binae]MBX4970015.1 hypothetical protein [Rhizobium binae]MBX4994898.1 hypothetical protein [Rhizobium binae]QSY84988.1 hypothetical protein J2J99_25735 [Rhizobium binae]